MIYFHGEIGKIIPSGLFYLNLLDRSISYIRGVWLVFIIILYCRNMSELNANCVDSDLMSHSVDLIWVFIVCQCPLYRMLGINMLSC